MMRSITILVLPSFAAGVQLWSDHTLVQAQLGSDGEATIVAAGPTKTEMFRNLAAHAAKGLDLCNFNYTAGVPKKSNCTKPQTQKLIEEESMCLAAANISCPDGSCLGSPFLLNNSIFFDKYPMRCFMTDDTPPKWFFNPVGYWPTAADISGTPICVEVEYIEGKKGSNDCGSDEYTNILSQKECRTSALCMNNATHEQFTVLNATDQKKYPKGCHIQTDGEVSFNELTTGSPSEGTPLCHLKVKSTTVR